MGLRTADEYRESLRDGRVLWYQGARVKCVLDDPDLRVIRRFPCAVERALVLLEGNDSPTADVLRADLEARLLMLRNGGREDDANVLNRREYLNDGGEELAALAFDVLTLAEADCLKR